MSLFKKSAKELQELLHSKEITIADLTKEAYDRIDALDGEVGAFLALNKEQALKEAEEMDKVPFEERGPLFGMPIGVKDNIVTEGLETTCASKILEGFNPIYNATVVNKLKEAGMVNVGKINMDEFAMGSANENSSIKPVHNPWNFEHVPGGSSGGSAAAVAAGEVPFSLGSDTGGSIRQPAAYCGVVGMKPTYGRVSRFGLVAFASSLDQIGPITRNVRDNALLLEAIAGVDAHDSTSANVEVPHYVDQLTGDIKGLKIAVPKEYLGEGVGEAARKSVLEAIEKLKELGATVDEVSLPHSKYALAAYYILSSSEASSNLSRFDGIRYGFRAEADNLDDLYTKTRAEGFGDEVKRRIMLGTYSLSAGTYDAYYKKAQQVRTLIKQDFDKVFEEYDVIVGPTSPTAAFKLGENLDDPMTVYANDILTVPINLAGVPAISIPCGFDNGLPLGLQIIGKYFEEGTVYRVADAFEKATDYHEKTPQTWEVK
ncbi:Asp-tRNA(Asn)/Glu-tRNA(Gln) amidotransferase subunit GatA [Rummeliibacillus sp. G93]|uniref:Asp-tRNA(Asn)/Glu-tRNA(Gln) amidotransferase subunit GatA n=1 Tax=Rummeliibacillus TaxID=648802 RepID=UPI00116B087D|nr:MULTISPECIES: Asp-tRNA(Asn)/Glu-tRNA(Gln) amidotransferase subunit GatA [Rummeliibacillus]MBB5170689.1 aspartyl-tRNA(Asn)/glutamyl-tRNA(Gln) amidotransferase subunit A [Rummeliibacillus stabekisii]MCM3317516.1 Asp-tRNA(Asn)/Glu-tRNA(Gln) amidotransferase subunit GatA [Rummeliibacillus stabekisii]UQW96988.1 Asp-tRNA(Asn)/Glu-tRNA(Gln) amidotransferase subunit GatA [Rummeliibacillus sp. G93]GEL06184.1 glutamyl-tRNA(Gln) amidotransferase subunit A [Rummeliibacillus stabekisii]